MFKQESVLDGSFLLGQFSFLLLDIVLIIAYLKNDDAILFCRWNVYFNEVHYYLQQISIIP